MCECKIRNVILNKDFDKDMNMIRIIDAYKDSKYEII